MAKVARDSMEESLGDTIISSDNSLSYEYKNDFEHLN